MVVAVEGRRSDCRTPQASVGGSPGGAWRRSEGAFTYAVARRSRQKLMGPMMHLTLQ